MATVRSKASNAPQVERRGAVRRRLCLEAHAALSADLVMPAVIHELSRSGFLMEVSEQIAIGDSVELRMADLPSAAARVIWSCGSHYGCEFQRPLSKASLSTALLKARPAAKGEALPRRLKLAVHPIGGAAGLTPAAQAAQPQLRMLVVSSVLLWAVIAALIAFSR
jgi:hypothetical protein